jgi:hypothetical protein
VAPPAPSPEPGCEAEALTQAGETRPGTLPQRDAEPVPTNAVNSEIDISPSQPNPVPRDQREVFR